jgi:two-component system chemotaxis response regulator CheY
MDFVMPRYSGLGVLSALRRANWFTPVIMMSGVADDDVRQKAKALGAAAFLRKPFDMDDLRTAVVNAAVLSSRAKAVDSAT